MMSQNEQIIDRRVTRTKEALLEALVSLMHDKPLHSITVAELARRANINRATFYLHYQDITDMVSSIQLEACEEIAGLVQLDENNQLIDIFGLLLKAFQILDTRRLFFAAMFGANGDSNFTDSVIMTLWDCLSRLDDNPIPRIKWDRAIPSRKGKSTERDTFYYYIFYVNGFIGLIKTWIVENRKETSSEMAALSSKLLSTLDAVRSYEISQNLS